MRMHRIQRNLGLRGEGGIAAPSIQRKPRFSQVRDFTSLQKQESS